MNDFPMEPKPATRITCMAHRLLARPIMERLTSLGAGAALVENARCVRQRVRARGWGLPGQATDLDDSPMDVFRVAVAREAADRVARELIEAGELRTPGHGMLYAQDLVEYSRAEPPAIDPDPDTRSDGMLRDMALLTCILSMAGSGEQLARIALTLGAGVPVVSRGIGTGIRDRLGLLRIAITPEKEIVRLMIPAHDADGIRRLLIEEGRLDRPGGGFLYQTPIRAGLADPLLRIGRQRHAASMEQIIAALDDIKAGTAWRKRFVAIEDRPEHVARLTRRHYREIVFTCSEGRADDWVRVAMTAGADGATTSRARRLGADSAEGAGVARETGVLCVPSAMADAVLEALRDFAARSDDSASRIQALDAPAVFTHQRKR